MILHHLILAPLTQPVSTYPACNDLVREVRLSPQPICVMLAATRSNTFFQMIDETIRQ